MQIKTQTLTPNTLRIIRDKATEPPFSGKYNTVVTHGTYLCRQCGLSLFRGDSQFDSGCGWPSFDEEISNAVKRLPDPDGHRTEILCARCNAHLGHVFQGEYLTTKSLRHCVNALSLDFVEDDTVIDTEEALFAAGCFWGVEYYLQRVPGVLKTEVGYAGGHTQDPSYNQICQGNTGHQEVVRVIYDPTRVDYATITRTFFEIHDPTQGNGQGPDIGEQYFSVIFYYNNVQNDIAENLKLTLQNLGYAVVTRIKPVSVFWPAEASHQKYYDKAGKQPYCHGYTQRFGGEGGG